MKDCVLFLVRSSEADVEELNVSLSLVETNLLAFCSNVDVLIFHEKSFHNLKHLVRSTVQLKYIEIEFKIPSYSAPIREKIPEFFPHPTHGKGPVAWGHPGFSMGYRHMCRFFSGAMYENSILHEYDMYLRLDTDSRILSPLGYNIFDWARSNSCFYGYIKPAVQVDNPAVVFGLKEHVQEWVSRNRVSTFVDVRSIPSGEMFYTNFELAKTSWFLQEQYQDFFHSIDDSGGIYINRWGDAPIKLLGVRLLMEPSYIKPVSGFVYKHGAVYSV